MAETARRLAIGLAIGSAYAAYPGADAVIIGGSVSRGHADRWSDIDIGIFWRTIPPESIRSSMAASAHLREWRGFEGPSSIGVIEEDARSDGVKIDLVHMDRASVERVLNDVIDLGDASLDKQVLIAAIHDGTPVAGEASLAQWRSRMSPYPEALRAAMVQDHLVFGPHIWLDMLADREDLLALHDVLCRIERAILGILLGVNGIYAPSVSPKWTRRLIERLNIAPCELADRFDRLLRAEAPDAIMEAGRLIDETLTLVERHLPVVDTRHVRLRVAQAPRTSNEGT